MEKVKTGLRGMNASDKLLLGMSVYARMSGNPDFPFPEPSMAELLAACEELRNANAAARDRGRTACLRKKLAVAAMDQVLSRLAAYVNSKCLGDAQKLINSGFSLVKQPAPISDLHAPLGLRSILTGRRGCVDLRWDRVPGAIIYIVEISTGGTVDARQWKQIALASKPRCTVRGLEPGNAIMFRVAAMGSKVESLYTVELFTRAAIG